MKGGNFWKGGRNLFGLKNKMMIEQRKKILQIHHVWDLILRTILVIFGHSPFHQMARVFCCFEFSQVTLPGHCTVMALSSINNPSMD